MRKNPSLASAQVPDDTNLQPGVAALRDMLFLSCMGIILHVYIVSLQGRVILRLGRSTMKALKSKATECDMNMWPQFREVESNSHQGLFVRTSDR